MISWEPLSWGFFYVQSTTCHGFHQHFTRAFFIQHFGAKNYEAKMNVEKSCTNIWLSYEKFVCKMLMKLTPAFVESLKWHNSNAFYFGSNPKLFYFLANPEMKSLSECLLITNVQHANATHVAHQVSISLTLNVQIFCMNVV